MTGSVSHVAMGEVLALEQGVAAILGLGSCVALVLVGSGPGAVVAHIVLPGAGPDARYAEAAVAQAVRLAGGMGWSGLRGAYLAGGAHLLTPLATPIGRRTVEAVHGLLARQGILVLAAAVGGRSPRNLWVNSAGPRVTVWEAGADGTLVTTIDDGGR
jgi:chemotaxis receptor (MCP) glutamine deamidase CheD